MLSRMRVRKKDKLHAMLQNTVDATNDFVDKIVFVSFCLIFSSAIVVEIKIEH